MIHNQDPANISLRRSPQHAGPDRPDPAHSVGARAPHVAPWLAGPEAPSDEPVQAIGPAPDAPPDWLVLGAGPMAAAGPPAGGAGPAPTPVWDFRPAPRDGGRDFGNANVWSFDPGLEVFVREVLQNALDAAASPDGRVDVTFRLVRLAGDDKRAFLQALEFDALRAHLAAAAASGQKLGALLRDGLGRLDGRDLLLLVVEDRGTVGLTGPERGEGHFTALCRDNLHSTKGATAAGSYGLGKAALWRASRLATVVFHSRLSEPEGGRWGGRLLGRCELAWHELEGAASAGPGWFGRPAADGAESIWGADRLAAALYLDRQTAGTSACVVAFHDAAADGDRPPEELAGDLARAAARNFFPALVAGRLGVRVEVHGGRRAQDARRPSWARDVVPDDDLPNYARMLRAYRDGATAERLGEAGEVVARPVALAVPERTADGGQGEVVHHAVLLVTAAAERAAAGDGPSERANELVAFRGPGMVVERRSLQGACLGARPVHALLLCGLAPGPAGGGTRPASPADRAAERFLQAAEPPAHDRWTATPNLKAAYAHGCVARLRQFLPAAVDGVRAVVKAPAEGAGDGPRALRDLLRLDDGRGADDGPRVIEQSGAVDQAGRWAVTARIRMRRAAAPTLVTPAVYFLGEGGEGVAVEWAALEPTTPGCVAEGGGLRLPAGAREVRFTGVTDPRSHPIPAAASCVAVGIRRFAPIRETRS